MPLRQTSSRHPPGTALLLLVLLGSVPPCFAEEAVPVGREIAVLPLVNRTGGVAPVSEIRDALAASLEERGLAVLERNTLERFMRARRMRYTGGISREMARALRAETGARAVLVTSLDLYQESNPPKAGMISRLVSTGEVPRVLWMDSAQRTGDESPGLLELGVITESQPVMDLVIERLTDSLSRRAAGAGRDVRDRGLEKTRRRYRPKVSYASLDRGFNGVAKRSIAVLPFANESTTRHAGEILTDQLVRHLAMAGAPVIEPGVVRQMMLEARQIQPKGPSIPQVDILRASLDVDAVVYGEVAHYQEAAGGTLAPVLGFSLRAVDTESQQVFWSSVSHTKGDDGVFFFDVGEIASAHRLASELSRAIVVAWMGGNAGGVNGARGGEPDAETEEDEEELAIVAGDADRLARMLDAAMRSREALRRQLESTASELAQARKERDELDRQLRQSRELGSGSTRQLAEMTEQREAAARRLTESERRESMLKDSIDALELLLDEARVREDELLARIEELERLGGVQGEPARPGTSLVAAPDLPPAPEQTPEPATDEVGAAVRAWADAWSGQRVEDYLASYSSSFEPPRGLDRAAWEAQRRTRLARPEFIELRVESLRIESPEPGSARASFRQTYRSNTFADVVAKTLELRQEADGWKIVRERVGD